jgi:putative transposase
VAPSTFYAAKTRPLSARVQRDAILGPALIQLWTDNYGVYGAHKLCKTHAVPATTWAVIRLPG